jgi:hypothetical protein
MAWTQSLWPTNQKQSKSLWVWGQSEPAPTIASIGHSVHCEYGARVNQHPPLHQLAILSIGWVTLFHPAPHLGLTKIVPHSTILALWCFLLDGFFLVTPDLHTTLPLNYHPTPPTYPIDLATLLTYIFNLPTN